jgi:hypothetical protein
MERTLSRDDFAIGPMISLRTLIGELKRRRWVWLFTAALGLIIGVSLPLVIPHTYSAVTDLYIAQPPGVNAMQAMSDDVSLLQTEAVAKQVTTMHDLGMAPRALLSHYSGFSVSDAIMSITFNGDSQAQAISGDTAVAHAFLGVLARELRLQTDVLVRGLESQITSLNATIGNLNASINGLSAASPNDQTATQLTELIDQRGTDEQQVSQLQSQREQALLNEQSTNNVSHVLDPAAVTPTSTKKAVLEDGLAGLVAGLAVGMTVVILGFLLSARRPDRSTVAATLDAPVELSLGRYHSPRVMRRNRLARQLKEPIPAVRMIERRLRSHLESAPGSLLAVLTVGKADAAALAVGALVLDLSSEGHRVVAVDAAEGRILASALGFNSTSQSMETFELDTPGSSAMRVIVAPEDPAQMAQKPPPDDADAVLVLAALHPAFGAEHLASWVTDAVLIISAREVTLTRMRVSREMLRDAGISLRSVILLDSDPGDETSGALSPVALRVTPAESPE